MILSDLIKAFAAVSADFRQDQARAMNSALFILTIAAGVVHDLSEGELRPEGQSQAVALVRARVREYLLEYPPEEPAPSDVEELRSLKTALDFFEAQVHQKHADGLENGQA